MDWYDVGAMADILQVPSYIQDKVRKQYSSCEDSQKRVIMLYWMDTLYDASWSTLAGVLYYYEEETALTFCKGFLKVKQGVLLHLPSPTVSFVSCMAGSKVIQSVTRPESV